MGRVVHADKDFLDKGLYYAFSPNMLVGVKRYYKDAVVSKIRETQGNEIVIMAVN